MRSLSLSLTPPVSRDVPALLSPASLVCHRWVSCQPLTSPLWMVVYKTSSELPFSGTFSQSLEILLPGSCQQFGSDKLTKTSFPGLNVSYVDMKEDSPSSGWESPKSPGAAEKEPHRGIGPAGTVTDRTLSPTGRWAAVSEKTAVRRKGNSRIPLTILERKFRNRARCARGQKTVGVSGGARAGHVRC